MVPGATCSSLPSRDPHGWRRLTTLIHPSSSWPLHLALHLVPLMTYNLPKSDAKSSNSSPSIICAHFWRTIYTVYLRHGISHCLMLSQSTLTIRICQPLCGSSSAGLSAHPQHYCKLEGTTRGGLATKEDQEENHAADCLNASCASMLPSCCSAR